MPLQHAVEPVPVNPEELRGALLLPAREAQRALEVLALHLREGFEGDARLLPELGREVPGEDGLPGAKRMRALEGVLELTHVAGVRVTEEEVERLRRERLWPGARPGQLAQEGLDEERD